MTNLDRALLVTERVHNGQLYDIYPYMYHIRQVVKIADNAGLSENIQVACALHDAIEDGDLSYNDIKKAFGMEVAEIVYAVTDELGRNRKERKEKTYPKIRNNRGAILVKICDRIANMQHSKEYNSRLFEMYKKEHDIFYNSLNVIDGDEDIKYLFSILEKLL